MYERIKLWAELPKVTFHLDNGQAGGVMPECPLSVLTILLYTAIAYKQQNALQSNIMFYVVKTILLYCREARVILKL